jgi:hypothetical protein
VIIYDWLVGAGVLVLVRCDVVCFYVGKVKSVYVVL